jgi:hypothetical protein
LFFSCGIPTGVSYVTLSGQRYQKVNPSLRLAGAPKSMRHSPPKDGRPLTACRF